MPLRSNDISCLEVFWNLLVLTDNESLLMRGRTVIFLENILADFRIRDRFLFYYNLLDVTFDSVEFKK